MKLVFCGTPPFAVLSLVALAAASDKVALAAAGHEIALVVTQPDRPKGRGMELTASPVKQKALELGLPVAQPDKIKNNTEFRAALEAIAPDCIVVVGYGRIIPRWMLDLPRHGNLNLHASLLPCYRGAAPIQWAIASGETVTGNTIMRIDEGLDTGDILSQREMAIAPDDTSLTLAPRLAAMGAGLLVETLAAVDEGRAQATPQDHARATLAPILTREDGRIDFARNAQTIVNRHRGFQPWPGTFTTFRGRQLTLHSLSVACDAPALAEAEMAAGGERLLIGCGQQSAIAVDALQLEGKRRMSARDFLHGNRPAAGEKLGSGLGCG